MGDNKTQTKGLVVARGVGSNITIKGDAGLMLLGELPNTLDQLSKLSTVGLYINGVIANQPTITVGDVTNSSGTPVPQGSLVLGANSTMTVKVQPQDGALIVLQPTGEFRAEKGAKIIVEPSGDELSDLILIAAATIQQPGADNKTLLDGVDITSTGDKWGYQYNFTVKQTGPQPSAPGQPPNNGSITLVPKKLSLQESYPDAVYLPQFVVPNPPSEEPIIRDAIEQWQALQNKAPYDLDVIASILGQSDKTTAERTVALNAVSAPAVTGGVGFATMGAADLVTDGIYGHIDTAKASKNLWVNLLGARVNGKDDAFDFGKMTTGYKSTKYGAVVGFDMPVATGANAGVALSYVKDKVENKGAYGAENKIDTFGITAYGRYAVTDAIKVDAQLSYLHGNNKITDSVAVMDQDKAVNKPIEAKVKTNTFVASIRGGLDFAVRSFTVTPHIGLNVIYAKQGSFDTSVDGKTFANTSAKATTTVELPIGVTAKMAMDVKGWKVAPQADLSIAPIFGNRNTKYTITGVSGGTSEFEAQFAGKYVATAGLGVKAENKSGVSLGAFYNAVKTKNGLDNQLKIEIQKAF